MLDFIDCIWCVRRGTQISEGVWSSRKVLTHSQTSRSSQGSNLNCLQLAILLPEFYTNRSVLSPNQNNGITQLLVQVTGVESVMEQVLQQSGKPKDNLSSWENGKLQGLWSRMYDMTNELSLYYHVKTVIH